MVVKGKFADRDKGIAFVENTLKQLKVAKSDCQQASMLARHAIYHIVRCIEHLPKEYTIVIKKTLFFTDVVIEASGSRVEFDDEDTMMESIGPSAVLYRTRYHAVFKYERLKGINRISFNVTENNSKDLVIALSAMALGVAFGLVARGLLPEAVTEFVNYNILTLVTEVFMNALKIIIGPIVFFSLAACISRFNNLRDLGRLGVKTMGLYFFTTLVAIAIGFFLYNAVPVGNQQLTSYVASTQMEGEELEEYEELVENYEEADFSLRNLIASSVPDNFFDAFLKVNILQIIFLAIIVGIGIGRCGDYAPFLTNLVESMNRLLTVITTFISKFIPLAIFCAMATLVISTGGEALLSILSFALLVILGMFIMICFYGLLLMVTTGLNPLIFYRKFSMAMMTAFSTSSSTATIPTSIMCCKKMGMDDKVVDFTIPLGANINMDGSSLVFMMVVMFMSKIYGISLSGPMLASIVISIVFLALGSPSVAGADLVIIAVLLNYVGLPMESIGLILGIDAVFDMIQAMSNSTGDAVVSLIVSKSEKLLDINEYKS